VSSLALPIDNRFGSFCYDPRTNENFLAFYVPQSLTQSLLYPFFQWLGETIMFVPKWELENFRKDGQSSVALPVLGTKVACPTTLYKELKKWTHKKPSLGPTRKFAEKKDQNYEIVRTLVKEDYVTIGDKMRMKCPFHQDNVASSYYHLKEGFHFCYVCKRKRYAIGRDLKSENPEKFEMLLSANPRILDCSENKKKRKGEEKENLKKKKKKKEKV